MTTERATSIVLCICLSLLIVSQASAQMRPVRDKNEYRPVRGDFWAEVERAIKNGKALAVVGKSPPSMAGSPALDEWKIAVARGLHALGNPLHAQYLLTSVAAKSIGTRQGFEALRRLREIAKTDAIDETALEELAFDLDTKIDEPESKAMIGYFQARSLLRKGYIEWSQRSLGDVAAGTTYADELDYDRTLQILASGDSATAYTRFENLSKNPSARQVTARLSRLALARLIFERRDYRATIKSYTTIDLPTRERVRSLNELAWSYYYDRAYGKALGTIRAIKSAYFRQLLSPETYLVEMLIYRELCHFKTVKAIVSEFLETYKPLYSAIEARKPLDSIPQILQMILQEGNFQKRAQAIQLIRVERPSVEAMSFGSEDLREELLRAGEKREKLIDAEITRLMKTRLDAVANWFLDLREQAWFLDYESSMRMIQLNEDQKEEYEPRKADPLKSTTLFWPVNDEAWLDELFDYEVLVKDACGKGVQRRILPSGGG